MQIGLGRNHVDMLLNALVVSLFSAVTVIQLANCLPTPRVDSNYINKNESFNENNGLMIPSNNIPFKIQATLIKNRPPAYGPSEPYSSPSPLTQQTSNTHPTSATNSSMTTAPTSATSPSMDTAPTSATNNPMATAPASATSPSMDTAPTSATNSSMTTDPTAMTTQKPHHY
ncbi:cell wall integrity and stress response component 4-like [Myzus persicae]|uniref:cell wall integrity and stress response component 4-like n=1 Tax=Myzus persicae TaxID=13164 RepID=UPI000B938069|nr:cell wall integrity and stress response component 4-like [Myzus persicae]